MNGPNYHGTRISALDIRSLADALGGTVTGRNSVSAPGPAHTPQDRSLPSRWMPTHRMGSSATAMPATTGGRAGITSRTGSACRNGSQETGGTGGSILPGSRRMTGPPLTKKASAASGRPMICPGSRGPKPSGTRPQSRRGRLWRAIWPRGHFPSPTQETRSGSTRRRLGGTRIPVGRNSSRP